MERIDGDKNLSNNTGNTGADHQLVPFELKYRCGPRVSTLADVFRVVRKPKLSHQTPSTTSSFFDELHGLPQET